MASLLLASLLIPILSGRSNLRTWGDVAQLPGPVQTVAFGSDFKGPIWGMVLLRDSSIFCWNAAASTGIPSRYTAGKAIGIAAGSTAGLTILSDGSLAAFGSGPLVDSLPRGIKVRKVTALADQAMALTTSGHVVIWGLAITPGASSLPAGFQDSLFTDIAFGSYHKAAIGANGQILFWGNPFPSVRGSWSSSAAARALAVTQFRTWTLQEDGSVRTWTDTLGPRTVDGLAGIRHIAATQQQFLSLDSAGTLRFDAFSSRVDGEPTTITRDPAHRWVEVVTTGSAIGLVDDAGSLIAVKGSSLSDASRSLAEIVPVPDAPWTRLWSQPDAINLGETQDGRVFAWGNGSDSDFALPDRLGGWRRIACAADSIDHHYAAIRSDSSVVAWGGGLAPPPGLGKVLELVPWRSGFVALKHDGTLEQWGDTSRIPSWSGVSTMLGDGSTLIAIDSSNAIHVHGRASDTILAILAKHSKPRMLHLAQERFCIVSSSDSLECFHGSTTPFLALPLRRAGDVIQIANTWNHIFLLHSDGSLEGWRFNGTPLDLSGLQGTGLIAAGSNHLTAIALEPSGSVHRTNSGYMTLRRNGQRLDVLLEQPRTLSIRSLDGRLLAIHPPALVHANVGRNLPSGTWILQTEERSLLWFKP